MNASIVYTDRLELIGGTVLIVQAELEDRTEFARMLGAYVPKIWPPDLTSSETIAFNLAQLQRGADQACWWCWYVVHRGEPAETRLLVGIGGFNGKPSPDGTVEMGCSILQPFQNRGYATETVAGLLTWCFQHDTVQRVVAKTLPRVPSSRRVLEKNGFTYIGRNAETGMLYLELGRTAYLYR